MDLTDKTEIDYIKVDLLRSNFDLIYKIFQTSIEFGEIVKASANTLAQDMKVWVILYGNKNERNKAKKFISSLCAPQYTHKVKINKKIINILQTKNYMNNLMHDYQVYIKILDTNDLIIQGDLDGTSQVKCIISLEMNRLKDPVHFVVEENDDEDEIICINDPYEIFSDTFKNKPKNQKSKGFESELIGNIHKDDLIQFEPKKSTLRTKNDDDCEVIHFVPSTSSINSKNNKVLNEYAEMFSQEFDKETEKLNKVKRIDKLIAAMPDEQKISALNHVNRYQKKNGGQKKDSASEMEHENTSSEPLVSFLSAKDHRSEIQKSQPNLTDSSRMVVDMPQQSNENINFKPNENNRRARNRNHNKKSNHFSVERQSNLQDNENVNNFQRSKSNVPTKKNDSSDLRFIVIDGSNVAREHGKQNGKFFSCKGIKIVVDYFLNRGHKDIKALVPRFRRGNSDKECPTRNPEILDDLEEKGYLTYTPSRMIDNKLIVPYDDRFILNAAQHYNAVIVSNDNYRDLMLEKPEWKILVHNNLLQYSFIGDLFMVADDPMGRKGPNIEQFLSVNPGNNSKNFKKNQAMPVINSASTPGFAQNYKNLQPLMNISTENDFKKIQKDKINFLPKNKNERSSQETDELMNQLRMLLPNNNENNIKSLVHGNRSVRDINFFLNKLMK